MANRYNFDKITDDIQAYIWNITKKIENILKWLTISQNSTTTINKATNELIKQMDLAVNIVVPTSYIDFDLSKDQINEIKSKYKDLSKSEYIAYINKYINTELWQVHSEAVKNIIDQSLSDYNIYIQTIPKTYQQTKSVVSGKKIQETIAKWIASGKGNQVIKKDILSYFTDQQQKFWKVKYKNGSYYDLSTYTDMAIRTIETNSLNQWVVNIAMQNWVTKFVRREAYSNVCPICKPHDWEVFDITKWEIPPWSYHPNCRWYNEPII